jgi:deoxyribodipyrimidine photo-lyase
MRLPNQTHLPCLTVPRMDTAARRLEPPPPPVAGVTAAINWVTANLADVTYGTPNASPTIRGGDEAANTALARTDLAGYATRRSNVWPHTARGATALSPYIRHGLITLPQLWRFAADAPPTDRAAFRDELLWQEYARHLYARLGPATGHPLRYANPATTPCADLSLIGDGATMACLEHAHNELEDTGFLTNQQRLWLASHFTVRNTASFEAGEDLMYRQLLDGSRAANRLGWQWVSGQATGRPYAFTRRQVERYAPTLCASCPHLANCPIEQTPPEPTLFAVDADKRLRQDTDPDATGGPQQVKQTDSAVAPNAVWITAESLSPNDPALANRPDLPAVFVFDIPLLARLKLAPKRLVFLAETLGDLAQSRDVHIWRGNVNHVLSSAHNDRNEPLTYASTFTPVPGWQRLAHHVVELHPWPWLRPPHRGPVTSFTAWRKYEQRP